MPPDPHALKLYVDGSAFDNPGGLGGFAVIAEYPDEWSRPPEELLREGYRETTNNRMELSACISAFELVRSKSRDLGVQRVLVITDSMYVYENHRRAALWRRSKWRLASGRPVENSDLWKRFLSIQSKVGVRTEIIWQKGKGSAILKAVHEAAKDAAKTPLQRDEGFREGKIGRSKFKSPGASVLFPARGQEARIHVYRSGLVKKTDHKIFFNLYSEERQEFVDKFLAYAKPEQAIDLHRGHSYKVRFNENPRYPLIEFVVEEVSIK